MAKVKDLVGKKIGRLLVLKQVGFNKQGNALWQCLCDCGKIISVAGGHLTRTKPSVQSCGCLSRETGCNHFNWIGNKVGYKGAHDWLVKNKPKPQKCERCRERPVKELSFIHTQNQKRWSRNPDDYRWLCALCHSQNDLGKNRESKPLTKSRLHRIREFYNVGAATQRELGKMFKISQQVISDIILRKDAYKNI